MNFKQIVIIILIIVIILLIGTEKFTGFRKDGCGTEIENKDNLFPYIDKTFFVKYFTSPKLTYDNGDKLFPVNLFA